jgi:hypothetical protein
MGSAAMSYGGAGLFRLEKSTVWQTLSFHKWLAERIIPWHSPLVVEYFAGAVELKVS